MKVKVIAEAFERSEMLMSAPGYQEFMPSLLRITADSTGYSLAEAVVILAEQLKTGEDDTCQKMNTCARVPLYL